MILSDYYLMEEIFIKKSHRFDCITSTCSYLFFEEMAEKSRGKRFFCYYNGTPSTFTANRKRQAEKVITNGFNISSVYTPDLLNPLLGYGDINNTNDALLFRFSEDYKQIEIFVARGYKNHVQQLFSEFCEGKLDKEIDELKAKAIPTIIEDKGH